MKHTREYIYLTALLHDIGKFDCQSHVFNLSGNNELSEIIRKKVKEIPGIGEIMLEEKMDDEAKELIELAVQWSIGARDQEACVSKQQMVLKSIFNRIAGGQYSNVFPLVALELDRKVFPRDLKEQSVEDKKDYVVLWNKFLNDLELLPTGSFGVFIESLIFLLKKYVWCIPSNTTDMANVSLFEHMKLTATFADCLFRFSDENGDDFFRNAQWKRLCLSKDSEPVLLVGGDISGIQKFIYNISSNKAALSLKGRSFYLQLLIDSIIQRILSRVNATWGNVVYSSGGKFYMLLPNVESVKKGLCELGVEIENFLWKKHYGKLLFNWDFVSFSYTDAGLLHWDSKEKTLGDLWRELSEKLIEKKNQKFNAVLHTNFDKMFVPQNINPEEKICAVTGIESDECVPLQDVYVLPIVSEQVDLGRVLKDADYILTHKYEPDNSVFRSSERKFEIEIAGVCNYLFDQCELANNEADFRNIKSSSISRVKRINNTNFMAAKLKGQNVSYGFQFYGGNVQAKIGECIKTFEELADGSYLGILRMDVDNLGSIFIKGLPENERTFAAFATLSFLLDYFFSGYLNVIREKYGEYVNILYSGGDDVFAIGRWDKLLKFAHDVRKEFEAFVGRKDISISGGLVIVNSKFPIVKAAELAGEAENAAKHYGNGKKNALNLFGVSVSWEDEFAFVENYKKQFVTLVCDYDMPVSILHKLMNYYEEMKRGDLGYIWHTAYCLKRFADGKHDVVKEFYKELGGVLCKKRNYELIVVAARWAELELRMNKE